MTKDLAISLLSQGNNGEKILQILNTIADGMGDNDSSQSGTLEPIDFWFYGALIRCPFVLTTFLHVKDCYSFRIIPLPCALSVYDRSVRHHSTHTSHQIMELTKAFPPVNDLITELSKIEYKKHTQTFIRFVITTAAFIAAISTLLWEKIQVMKFKTPDILSEYFYFSVNLIGEPGDEIVGLSVGNRYVGLYNNSISWGILDQNGALVTVE